MLETERLMLIASPLMTRTPVFDRAAALAKATNSALHIVAFDYVEGLVTAGLVNERALAEMREGYLVRHREWLAEQAQAMHHLGIEVTSEVIWVLRPLDEILAHIQEMHPSMVIKELAHESWLARVLFSSLDMRLLHDCPVPLHLVVSAEHGIARKILAAVDPFRPEEHFEQLNDQIIACAEKLAAQCDADLHLLYAYDFSSLYAAQGNFGLSGSRAKTLYEEQGQAFEQLADRFGVPPERRHLIMGAAPKVIDAFARAEAIDIIVMGTVHRKLLNKLMGSTTEQVASHMPSSLLTVIARNPSE